LLGAPAIPAPGLHPFLGIGIVRDWRAVSISRTRTAPIALFRTSPHMDINAASRRADTNAASQQADTNAASRRARKPPHRRG